MRTSDVAYELPQDRIAQQPLAERDASRLLHVQRDGSLSDHRFSELPALLRPGDLLVGNDTRVRHARMHGRTDAGRVLEVLVVERRGVDEYLCLVKPARHARPGTHLRMDDRLSATVIGDAHEHPGGRIVRFHGDDVEAAMERAGDAPLPPYVHGRIDDPRRYQTVFARGEAESAAAPTAGLHFTNVVLDHLAQRGIGWTTVRLQVGLATFTPIRNEQVEDHRMHEERFSLSDDTAGRIAATRDAGGRVIAVGTTVMRVLETRARDDRRVDAGDGATSLFIRPGHRFRVADGLLTNFHQPRSSLLVLLAAFIGETRWRTAYEHALATGYRFLSFGDCMLCWRS